MVLHEYLIKTAYGCKENDGVHVIEERHPCSCEGRKKGDHSNMLDQSESDDHSPRCERSFVGRLRSVRWLTTNRVIAYKRSLSADIVYSPMMTDRMSYC